MTFEQAAAAKTLTSSEQISLWDAFYQLVPDGEMVPSENRSALTDLIKTAPLSFDRKIPHCSLTETVGYFPWRRDNGSVGLVSMCVLITNDCACMAEEAPDELAYYLSTKI